MIEIYIDGGTMDGDMYIGVLSTCDTFPLRISKRLGKGPTHSAEEEALYYCIDTLKRNHPKEPITIYTDYQHMVSMIEGMITAKQMKTYPKIIEIQSYIQQHGIELKWIKSTQNKAHHLVALAQNEHLYQHTDDSNSAIETAKQSKTEQTERSSYVSYLEKEIAKKDSLIKDLLKIVSKLNESMIYS